MIVQKYIYLHSEDIFHLFNGFYHFDIIEWDNRKY